MAGGRAASNERMLPPRMPLTAKELLLVAAGYLLGSLPMGLVIGRLRGVDLREHGSRNIGATNAGRVLGRPWFFVVFALDFGKAFVPALLVRRFCARGSLPAEQLALAMGAAAVLGHVFSVFLRFRGGKGVATAAGLFFALAPLPAGVAALAWLLGAKGSGYVSVGSLAAAAALPAACWLLPRWLPDSALLGAGASTRWAALLVAALIVVRHKANIGRLLRGEEPRANRPAA
jgi:glycerol-3-phosphate acyltransferase PlsY